MPDKPDIFMNSLISVNLFYDTVPDSVKCVKDLVKEVNKLTWKRKWQVLEESAAASV